jgi:ABC-type phosphate transport system permease subunit
MTLEIPPQGKSSRRKSLFITGLVLLIVSLSLNVAELTYLNDFLSNTNNTIFDWNGMYGWLFVVSLILLLIAIILMIVAEYRK